MSNYNRNSKIQQFMRGRNGVDALSRDLCFLSVIISLVGTIFRTSLLTIPALVLCLYSIWRVFSKKVVKRSIENSFYLGKRRKVLQKFNLQKRKWDERDVSRFFRCPNCGQNLRVPKGQGEIEITCPKCGSKFVKRT